MWWFYKVLCDFLFLAFTEEAAVNLFKLCEWLLSVCRNCSLVLLKPTTYRLLKLLVYYYVSIRCFGVNNKFELSCIGFPCCSVAAMNRGSCGMLPLLSLNPRLLI